MSESVDNPEVSLLGASLSRVEDPRFLRGSATYVDDLHLPHMLQVAFLRSPVAHADVSIVDTQKARDLPGVVDVVSAEDLRGRVSPIVADSLSSGWQSSIWPVLADGRVRYVGEVIAAVVAETRYIAEDAVEEIHVDYTPLHVVSDVEEALAHETAPLHTGWEANWFAHKRLRAGEADAGFAEADNALGRTVSVGRQAGMPIETRVCVASYAAAAGQLTFWTATQVPHTIRTGIADHLGLPDHRIQVISPDVGGGFGIKGHLFPEELVVAALSMCVGRPVKWNEDRREHLISATHARQHNYDISVAYDNDGTIRALKAAIYIDNGAYSVYPTTAAMEPGMALGVLTGMYDIRSYDCDAYSVATNKVPYGGYRGIARPSACFAIERVMDEVANELCMDPVQLRRRNLVTSEQMPYTTVTGLEYDSGDFAASFDKACEILNYSAVRDQQRRAWDEGRYLGVGVGCYVEQSAHGTAEWAKRGLPIVNGYDTSRLRMGATGQVVAYVTSHSHGQGHETSMAQMVAEVLAIPVEDVRISFGDTSDVSYGSGTLGSRSIVMAGGAAHIAAQEIRDKLLALAAHHLEVDSRDLYLAGGHVSVRGAPSSSVKVSDLARWAHQRPEKLPSGMDPTLEATANYSAEPGTGTFANAVHFALVEVDPNTGHVEVLRYVVAEDCGRMVNPMIVDGQVTGGVVQGIGGALLEEVLYDEAGQPLTTALMDYLLPTATDVPNIEVGHIETLSPFTIRGIKGMGEGGAVAPGAAIASAVQDALRPLKPHFAHHIPLTPERVVELIDRDPNDQGWRDP